MRSCIAYCNFLFTVDLAVWQTGIVAFPVDGVVTMADLQQHALGQLPQEFINMPNLLNQLVNSIAALQNQVNGLQIQQTDQFNGLQNQILALQNQFNDMRTDISLVNNRASALGTHPLMPLRLVGPVPAVFPATLTDLRHLTTASVDQLLVYYGLPNGGHLNVKRRRLAAHIGATHME